MDVFFNSFVTVSQAVLEIFILGLAGYLLSRFNVLSQKGLDDVGKVVIYFTLPALILFNVLGKADLEAVGRWWLYPVGTYLLIAISAGIGLSISGFLDWPDRRQFAALIAFPNTGYLPLALTATLLSEPFKSEAFLIIFLIVTGLSAALWSLGVGLISGKFVNLWDFSKRIISNPPLVATITSIALLLLGWEVYVPDLALDTASLAGGITVPLIMIVLGGQLANIHVNSRGFVGAISLVILLKLIIYPALALLAIYFVRPPEVIGFVLLLEAATTPATNLVIVGRHYGEETGLLNQGLLYSYLCAIVTIPAFISLFRLIYS
ncbi:MAG: AEC family transporter [Candidatus Acetothermia bacterium]